MPNTDAEGDAELNQDLLTEHAMDHAPTKVLLVSDNDDERELYESGLALHGFAVRSARLEDIPKGIDGHQPGLLLLSLRLGDDETWRRLEEIGCGSHLGVPGVLLTGSIRGDAANRLRAADGGCAAFVAKPCTPDALARVLRSVLAGERGLVVMDPSRYER
jgi:DNA-binding response OmpR family regulator